MRRGRLIAIGEAYGIKITRIRPCSSYYKANAAYRVSTDRGECLIKPFQVRPGGRRLKAGTQMSRAICHVRRLIRSGYPNMPQWMKTKTGRYGVVIQGQPYYMTDWIEGGSLSGEPREFEWLGQALAKLHSVRIDSGRGNACTFRRIRRFLAAGRAFQGHLDRMRGRHSKAARWFSVHGAQIEDLRSKAKVLISLPEVARLLKKERKENLTIHGDVTVPNIIVAADGIKLIDWDSVKSGSIYYEIAKTLSNTTRFDTGLMEAFLLGYERIKPLLPDEKKLTAALFLFPREVWSSAKNRAFGRKDELFVHVQTSWAARLKAAEWIIKWADPEKDSGGTTAGG